MAYNNFGNYGYGYPQYNSNMGYQNFQQPMAQQMQSPMMQVQAPNNDIPFAEALFGTFKEAEARIVAPNRSVCFVNNAMGEIYVKSADGMGNPSFKTYKLVGLTNNSTETQTTEFDAKNYLKKEDLDSFAMKNDLEGLATKQDLENFITRKDFENISAQIDNLQRKIKINEFLEGDKNGK